MIYQDSNLAQRSRLYELLEELKKHNEENRKRFEEDKRSRRADKVLRGVRARQKSFTYMLRIKAPVSLQEQWVNEDRARFNAWLNEEHFPYVSDYRSIPFEKWLSPRAGGQFSAPAVIRHRPKKIVNLVEEQRPPIFSVETENMVGQEEKPRKPIFSVETENMVGQEKNLGHLFFSVEIESVVGLEENVQVSEPKIDLENDSSEECSNDEQDQYTTSNYKTTSIDMVIGDMVLDVETTPIDMIVSDTADMEKSRSAKLFDLKAEIGEVIMPGGHCSTHSAAENEKYFTKSKIFGENSLFGLERNQFENFDIKRSRLGIKHRWPPPVYGSATFISIC